MGGPTGTQADSDITVGYNNQGSEELFARTADGSVWHNFYEGAGVWSGWYEGGGPTGVQIVSDLSVGINQYGNEELFALGSDGSVWHDYLESAGSWSGWGTLSGPSGVGIVSDITVGYKTKVRRVFARTSDGSVWHNFYEVLALVWLVRLRMATRGADRLGPLRGITGTETRNCSPSPQMDPCGTTTWKLRGTGPDGGLSAARVVQPSCPTSPWATTTKAQKSCLPARQTVRCGTTSTKALAPGLAGTTSDLQAALHSVPTLAT